MAYCERTDVESIFGVANVALWADLENNQDEDDIEARITWACDMATTKMNNRLRGGPYAIPFEEPSSGEGYDAELVNETARWAGVLLYESRGIEDTENASVPKISDHIKQVEAFIRLIRTGRMQLDVAEQTVTYPKVIK